jgi:hypothetical protein
MAITFVCSASSPAVEKILRELKDAEFTGCDVSVLMNDREHSGDVHDVIPAWGAKRPRGWVGVHSDGGLDWLNGIGTLTLSTGNRWIASGIFREALLSVAPADRTPVREALIDIGLAEFEARRFERQLSEGHALISVRCDDAVDIQLALEIFECCGSASISTAGEIGVDDDLVTGSEKSVMECS